MARGAGRGRSAAAAPAAPAAAAAGDAGGYYTFADPEHGDAAWHPKPHGPAVRPSWVVRPACAAAAQAVGGPADAKAEAAGKAGAKAPSAKGRLGGVAQLVAGSAIAAVGVPMLVLPGPGLLAIGGGVALAARGAKRAFGRR